MKNSALSILSFFICVSCFAELPNDTTYYYNSEGNCPSIDDEVLMIVSEGSEKVCFFYGTSDEFTDDPREGFLPGFIVLKATSLSMENGKFTCVLNSTNHKYTNSPINIGITEEIPNGYKPWTQINEYFWNQIEFIGTYDNEKIELVNKTFYPEEKRVFYKKSLPSIKTLYNKSLLSDSEAESNALGYVNYEDSDAYMSIDEMVPTINVSGHECVDLGLPSGILWSKCDIGASSPEIVGDKYAWGELEVHECNSTLCNHYKFFKEGSSANITKYNFKSSRGHVDNKKELDPCDDVAYVRYGKRWRIPSCKEWNELRQLCIWKPETYKGVEGFWVFGLNDNFIFVNNRYHWTRDLDDNDCIEAKRTYHVKDAFDLSFDTHYRPAAYPIRPICYPQ